MNDFNFKNKQQIIDLIKRADDNKETENLISYFAKLKKQRNPFYLEHKDLEEILNWKLRGQYGRQAKKRTLNTPDIIKNVTRVAFSIEHDNKNYETELKIKIFSTLYGVSTAISSAILTLTYPEKYGVIDFRIWRQLFLNEKTYFSTNDYIKYLDRLRKLALSYNMKMQEIDMAIWQYDIEQDRLR